MSITNLCVSVAVGIQQAMRMRHIFICGLPRPKKSSYCLINGTIFETKLRVLHIKCVYRFSLQFVETFFILRRNERDMIKMSIGLHVKYTLFWSDFNGLEISLHIFEKYSNIKFHEKQSRGSRFVPCAQTDGHT